MRLKLHEDVYKVKDSRVKKLLAGTMTLETFAALITKNDPFVLIHDTIYVMTEQEYYSTHAVYPAKDHMEHMFRHLMTRPDLSVFSDEDRKIIEKARADYPTCPVCQKRKWMRSLYKIGLKYNLQSELKDCQEILTHIPKYPEVSGIIYSNVTALLPDLHEVPPIQRKGCIACVEKHLSQAYILAAETVMGYPEHIVLVVGHLNEAIHELPDEAFTMKQTLEFCAAKTVETNTPFIPLWAILSQLLYVRRDMEAANTVGEPVYDIGIDFTPEVENEWHQLPQELQAQVCNKLLEIDSVITRYREKPDELCRFEFSGLMASTAEMIAQVAPSFANMLRDRRLAFTASPDLMDDAGYGITQLLMDLSGDHSRADLGVEDGVTDDTAGVLKSE